MQRLLSMNPSSLLRSASLLQLQLPAASSKATRCRALAPRCTYRLLPAHSRTMASAGKKHEWIVILPDHDDALPRRMDVRPQHLNNVKEREQDNFWLFGGGYLEDIPKDGEGPKIKGSIMLGYAETKEQVLEELKKDIYTEKNVWDWSKVQIYPFISAVRKSM